MSASVLMGASESNEKQTQRLTQKKKKKRKVNLQNNQKSHNTPPSSHNTGYLLIKTRHFQCSTIFFKSEI